MRTLQLNTMARTYRNEGQHAQQVFIYTLSGAVTKADNIPHDVGTDYLHYSIKSARATVCKGLDLLGYLATDKASEFVYITKTLTAYIMSKSEYVEFCNEFAKPDRESTSNGGAVKLRLGKESQKMLEWLSSRARG